jgi:hypothetical protein
VAEFAKHFDKSPEHLGPEEIRSLQLFLLHEKGVKLPTYIQAVCELRFFYQNTLHWSVAIDRIPLPRYEKKLPAILSKAEGGGIAPPSGSFRASSLIARSQRPPFSGPAPQPPTGIETFQSTGRRTTGCE